MPSIGSMWSPGYFRADLRPDREVTLVASTEPWEAIYALSPQDAAHAEHERRRRLIAIAGPAGEDPLGAELVLAADQFIITPAGRAEEAARARAAGEEVRTVIAGYHWFTDWGRDTMISLEGLTLTTRRFREAAYILKTFGHYIRDGLIPNMFPDGAREGLYHTADATLWFFHAVQRYLDLTGDGDTVRQLMPRLTDVVVAHLRGTKFGIAVDPADGLLRQGEQGYQLTWMDAKVDEWVVTPRRGKAVEINALWYNALCLLDGWVKQFGGAAADLGLEHHAARARESFNRRFWFAEGGYLYDVVDGEAGDDTACRPNQVFTISLDHPVLVRERWEPVMEVVRQRLLTPVGLRSLAPGHKDYKAEVLRRSAFARRGLPPGNGLGLADWAIRRCLAQAASGGQPGRTAPARRLRQSPVRGVRRVDQRDLRRGTAVHSAWLRGPGLERRRSAAMPGQDGCPSANIRAFGCGSADSGQVAVRGLLVSEVCLRGRSGV